MKYILFIMFWEMSLMLPVSAQNGELPNIVIFLADDLGYEELGCQGNTDIPTPNIDQIASDGIRFTNGYVCNSYCSPSRAGLMTGRYPNRFGYESNIVGHQNEDPNLGLPMEETTLAEYLLEAGYVSAIIGKWHQGGTAKYHPYRQGFDEFYGFLHEGHFYVPEPYKGVTTMLRRTVLPGGGTGKWISRNERTIYTTHMGHDEPDYNANNPIVRGSQPVWEEEYLTDAFTREAIDFIERNQDLPFFLYIPYNAVHSPLQATDQYMDQFSHIDDIHRRIFAAMLSNLDDSVGDIMQKLREEGLEEKTIVVFLSDNGGPTRELTSSNLPLRGGKGDYYEGGIRIPFIIQWKGYLPQGEIYDKPVISLDLLPTFAAAAHKPVTRNDIDGVNLLPYLTGKKQGDPHEFLFWSYRGRMAFRQGNWKIVQNRPSSELELYDLENDISESENLIEKHPERAAKMWQFWQKYENEIALKDRSQ